MARTYYLVPEPSHTFGHHHVFQAWAALSNPDGTALLSASFYGDSGQEDFEAQECVQPLPTSGTLPTGMVTSLSWLGVTSTSTLVDVKRLAKAVYSAM